MKLFLRFPSKPSSSSTLTFAGVSITPECKGYSLHQEEYAASPRPLQPVSSFHDLRRLRHQLRRLSLTRVNILSGVNILSQVTLEAVNSLLQRSLDNPDLNLHFQPFDLDTTHIMVYSDASFAGNTDGSSQIGFIMLLADESRNAHVLLYSITKSKRVVRSVVGA